MSKFGVLDISDKKVVGEIIDQAYEELAARLRRSGWSGSLTPFVMGRMGVCPKASSILTRIVLEHGYYATREQHYGHAFTSVAPPGPPTEDDPIICLTAGQFFRDSYPDLINGFGDRKRPAYVGPRIGMSALAGEWYDLRYSAAEVDCRQTAYTTDPDCMPPGYQSDTMNWLYRRRDAPPEIEEVYGQLDRSNCSPEVWATLANVSG